MYTQYYAQRFKPSYPFITRKINRKTVSALDPRDRKVGTVPVGTILYIPDGIRPFTGLARPVICREPWIVEAWLPREYAKWDGSQRRFRTVYIRGGHLAVVCSLRNRNRVQRVADWILVACIDAGLEKLSEVNPYSSKGKS
jgi:hypothetical protein